MTSSADLRRDDDGAGADADDRTIQKPPGAIDAIEQESARESDRDGDRERTLMATAPKPNASTRSPISSPNPSVPSAVRPAAGLGSIPADKLPPPPSHPLRPRLPSSAGGLAPASRPIPTPQPFAVKSDSAAKDSAAKLEVARPEPVKNEAPKSDSKSDVRTVHKADSGSHEVGPPTIESEPPPASEPATSPKSPGIASSPAPMTPKIASGPGPMTPKMANAPPKSANAPSPLTPKMATAPASKPRSPSKPDAVDDGDGDSITATAPRVPASIIPLSAPKQVAIRTLAAQDDDDAGDETEVKTLSANIDDIVRGIDRKNASEADAPDDSVTAQAPIPPVTPAAGAPAIQPKPGGAVIRIGEKSLMPSKGAGKDAGAAPYNPDEEDSVTARSLEVKAADYPDDSVTAQSPNTASGGMSGALPPPIDGETEGTTKRVRTKKPKPGDPKATEADEPDDSVTAAAPGHLTNMLRVIAAPTDRGASEEQYEDEDPLQAHTQVMLNAPVKPPEHSQRGGRPEPPNSESGLLVAGRDANALGGDRASLGALGVARDPRHDGAFRGAIGSDPNLAGTPMDRVSHAQYPNAPIPMPAAEDDKKPPPYALLVGVVAAISILIPLLLFIVLSQSNDDVAPRVTAQPSPDPVGVTGARPKAKPTPSTTPSSQQTPPRPTGGGPINRGPLRR